MVPRRWGLYAHSTRSWPLLNSKSCVPSTFLKSSLFRIIPVLANFSKRRNNPILSDSNPVGSPLIKSSAGYFPVAVNAHSNVRESPVVTTFGVFGVDKT